MSVKPKRNLSWNPNLDPVEEDRIAFLTMNAQEPWNDMMELILATYPGGSSAVKYDKRKIERTLSHPFYVEILRALNLADVKFVLVGSLAVSYYGDSRYTGDMDLWINPEPGHMEK